MQPVEIEEDYSYEKPGKEVFNPDHTQKQTEEPVGIKEKLLSAVGWETGKEINFAIGVGIDVLLFVIWLILIFTLLPSDQRNSLWYMPILGIIGATIGVGTPVGGGIVYFPVLTLLNVPANQAVAFNYATAVANLGGLGLLAWARKRPETIKKYYWALLWVILWGCVGAAMATYLFPIEQEKTLRILFLTFCVVILLYIIYLLWREFDNERLKNLALESNKPYEQYGDVEMTCFNLFGLSIVGIGGGILCGWLSIGLDVAIFCFLTFFYRMEPVDATIIAVITMGFTAAYPLIFKHIIEEDDVPYRLWLMVEGGCIIGSRLGPIVISLMGNKTLYFVFGLLLLAEIIRSFVVLVILPATAADRVVGDV